MIVNAVDACVKYVPALVGFSQEFSKHCKASGLDYSMKLLDRSAPIGYVNFDNPGHVLLAMRGLTGVDICRAHTAYILALALATCPPEHPEALKDPKRLVWIHASICKVLGSSYCALPVSPLTRMNTEDHISILMDLVVAACPEIFKTSTVLDEEKVEMATTLRLWHCPKYIRDMMTKSTIKPVRQEGRRWSFDRPRERAHAFDTALLLSNK